MASQKRMGSRNSPTCQSILNGAERVLQLRGYGAITSRSIADEAGVKQQLIYYYFDSVDELMLAAFQRRTARGIERLKKDVVAERPIHALWEDFSNAMDARLTFEYMALANHHVGIREEVTRFLEESRRIQIEVVKQAYQRGNVDEKDLPPEALVFLISSIAMVLNREAGIGVTSTHKEVRSMVRRFLKKFE